MSPTLKFTLSLILLFQFLNGGTVIDDIAKPDELFSFLSDNKGWVSIEMNQGANLSIKSFQKSDLVAFRVQKKTNIRREIIKDIVMDVKNYARYFGNQEGSFFQEIMKTDDWVDGHHYILINIPLMSDREYFFRVESGGYSASDSNSIVHWYIKQDANKSKYLSGNESRSSIIIDYGAGTWATEKADDSGYIISYRLLLDPGGSIPDFVVELMNKTSVVNIFNDVLGEASRRNGLVDQ